MNKGKTAFQLVFIAFALLMSANGLLAQTGTFTEHRTLTCGDTAVVSPLGYPTWNDPHIIRPPRWGYAQLYGDLVPPNIMVYEAPPYFQGTDTVVIECAHATQITCDTGIYVYEIKCDSAVSGAVYTYQVPCGDTLYAGNLSGWGAPFIVGGPDDGKARIILGATDGAGVEYIPDPTFEGLDYVLVHYFNDTLLYLFQVSCQATGTSDPGVTRLNLYPNPAAESVWFQGPAGVQAVTVMDVNGRVYNVDISEWAGIYRFDISALPAGVYSVQLRSGDARFVGRMVKVR